MVVTLVEPWCQCDAVEPEIRGKGDMAPWLTPSSKIYPLKEVSSL